MTHRIQISAESGGTLAYGWRYRGAGYAMTATVVGPAAPLSPGSEAQFITEHYWGYTRQRNGGTLEYQVEHPPWAVWTPTQISSRGPAVGVWPGVGAVLAGQPASAYVALTRLRQHRGVRLPWAPRR
jgi:hypothetical protein